MPGWFKMMDPIYLPSDNAEVWIIGYIMCIHNQRMDKGNICTMWCKSGQWILPLWSSKKWSSYNFCHSERCCCTGLQCIVCKPTWSFMHGQNNVWLGRGTKVLYCNSDGKTTWMKDKLCFKLSEVSMWNLNGERVSWKRGKHNMMHELWKASQKQLITKMKTRQRMKTPQLRKGEKRSRLQIKMDWSIRAKACPHTTRSSR